MLIMPIVMRGFRLKAKQRGGQTIFSKHHITNNLYGQRCAQADG